MNMNFTSSLQVHPTYSIAHLKRSESMAGRHFRQAREKWRLSALH